MIESLLQRLWELGHKEHWPLPEEKMVLLGKAQLLIVFKTCDLRLDSCEPTLKSKGTPT